MTLERGGAGAPARRTMHCGGRLAIREERPRTERCALRSVLGLGERSRAEMCSLAIDSGDVRTPPLHFAQRAQRRRQRVLGAVVGSPWRKLSAGAPPKDCRGAKRPALALAPRFPGVRGATRAGHHGPEGGEDGPAPGDVAL